MEQRLSSRFKTNHRRRSSSIRLWPNPVSRRVGHIHLTVDDAPWVWVDASGEPVILNGLPPGPHKILIQLVNANHQLLDQGTVKFTVPEALIAASAAARTRRFVKNPQPSQKAALPGR